VRGETSLANYRARRYKPAFFAAHRRGLMPGACLVAVFYDLS